jgi:hypothetical protein
MYEMPTLITIGDAKEVIRGLSGLGYDLDTLSIRQDHEFQCDAEGDSTITG